MEELKETTDNEETNKDKGKNRKKDYQRSTGKKIIKKRTTSKKVRISTRPSEANEEPRNSPFFFCPFFSEVFDVILIHSCFIFYFFFLGIFDNFSVFFLLWIILTWSRYVATALQNCHSRRFQYHLFFDPKYHFAVRVREKKKSRIEPSQIESSRIEMNRIKSDMGVVEKGNPAFNTAAGIEAERAAR